MSFGKGTTVNTAQPTQAQTDQINATTGFLTGSVIPAYQQVVQGQNDLYNQTAPGVTNAAQNLARIWVPQGKAHYKQVSLVWKMCLIPIIHKIKSILHWLLHKHNTNKT